MTFPGRYSNEIYTMKIVHLSFIFSIFLLACSNDSEDNNNTPEPLVIEVPDNSNDAQMLLRGENSKIWVNESFELSVFGSLECRKDDIFTFFNDGTYEYDGGEMLCGDSDSQQIQKGTWELNLDENQIIFDKGSDMEARADLIVLKEDKIRAMGSWNNLDIDATYTSNF